MMKKEIKYVVKGEEWESAKDKTFSKLNSRRKIDGFRKGKATRTVFEKKFPGEIVMEAANSLIDKKYREVVMDKDNIPVVEPKVEIVKLDDNELVVKFIVITEPEVKLGDYKNLDIKKETVKVTKKEIQEKIDGLVREYAELVVKEDGEVEDKDTAIIDFEGFKDDVAFEGGKGENYSLEIGSNTFIPGFEEGVIGMKKGETKDLKLTFPKDYGVDDLAGADVVFKVTVNEIKTKILPELDKDFFDDLGMKDVNSKEELEAKMKEEIKETKEREAEAKYIDSLLKTAVKNMNCDIDEEIITAEAESMYNDFLERMKLQGLTEEVYLQYADTTKEDIVNHMKEEALRRLQNSYLLNAIIAKEKIEVTEEETNEEIADIAKKYEMTKEDVISSIGGVDAINFDLKARKAIEIMKGEK
jgi:trigger factor